MKPTKISYLIALFNKSKYIEECIRSIIEESEDDLIIEICVVDDGSSDGSLELIKQKFSLKNISCYRFEKNQGKVAAYNKAFELATGDYICLFGADDVVIKGRTKLLLAECRRDERIIYGGLMMFGENISTSHEIYPPREPKYHQNILGNRFSGGCFMAPYEKISHIFPIPEKLKFEDWWIANRALKNGWVKTISVPVTNYRIHESNDCGTACVNLDSIRRDYYRHFDYLSMMSSDATDKIERYYINRALLIRKITCGESVSVLNALSPPFNKSSFLLFLLCMLGPRFVYEKIIRFK